MITMHQNEQQALHLTRLHPEYIQKTLIIIINDIVVNLKLHWLCVWFERCTI